MTKQQIRAWQALHIYRLRGDTGLCLVTGKCYVVISAGAIEPNESCGQLISTYVVVPN